MSTLITYLSPKTFFHTQEIQTPRHAEIKNKTPKTKITQRPQAIKVEAIIINPKVKRGRTSSRGIILCLRIRTIYNVTTTASPSCMWEFWYGNSFAAFRSRRNVNCPQTGLTKDAGRL